MQASGSPCASGVCTQGWTAVAQGVALRIGRAAALRSGPLAVSHTLATSHTSRSLSTCMRTWESQILPEVRLPIAQLLRHRDTVSMGSS